MSTPSTILLTDLLSLSPLELQAKLNGIYEHSPWVAESAFPDETVVQSLKSLQDVFRVMKKAVGGASLDRKITLLKEHPDLCKRAAVDMEGLTASSREEQAKAKLGQLTEEEYSFFTKTNDEYRSKFGFPFILAVRNATKQTVLQAIKARVKNTYEREFAASLAQVHKIAWMRLIAMIDLPESNRGFLTCHVLDTAGGCPAANMRIELYRLNDGRPTFIQSYVTNEDGRLCGGPALKGNDFQVGTYQWIFYVGDYFSSTNVDTSGCPFFERSTDSVRY
uniref:2-oxo-4-hydroxy-4-carboxy-5-ureidoimidazoline decarboxylase n=1 Tax=Leptocylindrus danicus TaxID=163516 RepID=A0A7S2L0B2_9STRA